MDNGLDEAMPVGRWVLEGERERNGSSLSLEAGHAQMDPSPCGNTREKKKEGRKGVAEGGERAEGGKRVLGVGDVLRQREHMTAMGRGEG